MNNAELMRLARAIAAGDTGLAARLLDAAPLLAGTRFEIGAARNAADGYFLGRIGRHVYAGDTALHIAAAGYEIALVEKLIALGADVRAKNRRGGEPLHAAAVGLPGSPSWNPRAQAVTIACLIAGGADPNAVDKSGVTPLHRAVRTRCAAAVEALLAGGADARRTTKGGSTPMLLAQENTGRGGSGSPEAKAQQREIKRVLERHLAAR